MRKRLMNISKRCMVAIMSAAFIMSSVTVSMALPVGVYADEPIETSQNTEGGEEPEAWITVNEGEVLAENNETINENLGEITDNKGTVDVNYSTVVNNYGTVNNVFETENMYGTVENNYGEVTGTGSVTNNYGGTVSEGTTVTNNFWSVTIEKDANVTSAYDSGFVAKDGVNYIQTKDANGDVQQQGKITFTTDANHEIKENTEAAAADGFIYTVDKGNNGTYTATITSLTKNIKVNLTAFNLALYDKIKPQPQPEPEPEPEPQPSIEDGPSTTHVMSVAVTTSEAVTAIKGYVLNDSEKAAVATTPEEAMALIGGVKLENHQINNSPMAPSEIAMAKLDIIKNNSINAHIVKKGLLGLVVKAGSLSYADGRAVKKITVTFKDGAIPTEKLNVAIMYYTPGDATPHLVTPRWKNGKLSVSLPVPCNYVIIQ